MQGDKTVPHAHAIHQSPPHPIAAGRAGLALDGRRLQEGHSTTCATHIVFGDASPVHRRRVSRMRAASRIRWGCPAVFSGARSCGRRRAGNARGLGGAVDDDAGELKAASVERSDPAVTIAGRLLAGRREMRACCRALEWAATSLGRTTAGRPRSGRLYIRCPTRPTRCG